MSNPGIPSLENLSLNIKPYVPPTNPNLASEFYRRLVEWMNEFQRSLDEEHEVGARLVNFGQTVTFHVEDITYWNPSLIGFVGRTEDGSPVELIQHVTQISILLMRLKRADPTQPKRPIGFASWDEYDKAKSTEE
ncbi:TPA: hypothetical protein QDB26_005346 [Burkholderia vietnamiensis]|nr:hypothetical protein [Burkholderia vietnamiensis]HDR9216555.1 hypothetical protein [Burkholderia vietnamiensis]